MSAPAFLLDHRAEFQSALLGWFAIHQRPLPWRENPSLYKTVVSEFMLQQTQVKTVLPYFERWLKTLPDFVVLAHADEAQVLKLWEGLGYYSRARNLHRLAQELVCLASPPATIAEWQQLPGIGPYTAAAITSIALGQPSACVDGNVVRILARLTADTTPFRDSASAAKSFRPLAEALLTHAAPGDHNQAMMELGATVCYRQNPLCTVCPVAGFCAGLKSGEPEQFPQLAPKQIETVLVSRAWWIREKHLLLHRAAATARRFAQIYELPRLDDAGFSETALQTSPLAPLAVKKRAITRFSVTETIYDVSNIPLQSDAKPFPAEMVWVPLNQIETITLSGPHRRWIAELLRKI